MITLLIGLTASAAATVLLIGLVGFAKNGPWYRRNAERLMNMRVAAQFLAVLLLVLLAVLHQF